MDDQTLDQKIEALNEKMAARYTGMSVSYLRKARMEGTIGGRTPGPVWYKISRRCVYRTSDLDLWMAEHRRES